MAIATSNVKQQSGGSLNFLAGDWSSAVGDDSGTVTVGGARVYFAQFSAQDSVTGELASVPWTASTSGALTTVTFYPHDAVSSGRFLIAYA